jgi:hypothetical protein
VETSKKPKIEEAHVSKSSFNSKITVSPPTTQDTCGSQTRSTRDNVSILPTLSSIVVLAQKGGVKQWKRSAIGNLCESQVGGSHKNAQRSLEVPKENRLPILESMDRFPLRVTRIRRRLLNSPAAHYESPVLELSEGWASPNSFGDSPVGEDKKASFSVSHRNESEDW